MSLELRIDNLGRPGRRSKPISAEYVRDVEEADLELLAVAPRGTTAPTIQRITDRHHQLARLLASGMKDGEAALTVGYDISRVSIIKQSPAFQDLLAVYRSEVDRQFSSTLNEMAGLGRDALATLRERLEENPDDFSNRELMSLTTEMVDRTVDEGDRATAPTRIELVAPEVGEDKASPADEDANK